MFIDYFLRADQGIACPTCGRSNTPEDIYVGRSSVGHKFLFHTNDGIIKTYRDWEFFLRASSKKIVTDEGEEISRTDFHSLVAYKQKDPGGNHPLEFLDPQGYRFKTHIGQ